MWKKERKKERALDVKERKKERKKNKKNTWCERKKERKKENQAKSLDVKERMK